MQYGQDSRCTQPGCFTHDGNEDIWCNSYCKGTREKWHNEPATNNKGVQPYPPIPCYNPLPPNEACGGFSNAGCTISSFCSGGGEECTFAVCDPPLGWDFVQLMHRGSVLRLQLYWIYRVMDSILQVRKEGSISTWMLMDPPNVSLGHLLIQTMLGSC